MSSQPCHTSIMQEKKMQKTDVMINDSVEDCDDDVYNDETN